MIDIMKTVFVAAYEYEMRYRKHPVLFINRPLYNALMVNIDLRGTNMKYEELVKEK